MSQPKPKRQHYVPRWHLRRFRDPSAKVGQHYVAAYDRQTNVQHQRIAVTNVAVEADIYTLEDPGQADAYAIENQLAEIDERENKLVDHILARRSTSSEEILAVRAMLESLHARTRDLHQRIKHAFRGPIQRQLAEQMKEEWPQSDWPDELLARFPEHIEALERGEWRVEHEKDDLLALQFRQDSAFRKGIAEFHGFAIVWLPDAAFCHVGQPDRRATARVPAVGPNHGHWAGQRLRTLVPARSSPRPPRDAQRRCLPDAGWPACVAGPRHQQRAHARQRPVDDLATRFAGRSVSRLAGDEDRARATPLSA